MRRNDSVDSGLDDISDQERAQYSEPERWSHTPDLRRSI